MKKTELLELEGGVWNCADAGEAADWFTIAATGLFVVAAVATAGGAVAITAGAWSAMSTFSGTFLSIGNRLAGC